MNKSEKDRCADCVSRRTLLRSGAVGVVLAALPTAAGCMASNTAAGGPVAAGNVADVPIGTLELINGENMILARDAGGLYAMTRVCTHQGQLVAILGTPALPILHCYGHGSEFDVNGAVLRGPASSPLEHFRVDVADGAITIQGGVVVDPTARTQVT